MCHYPCTQSTRLIVEGFRSHEASGASSRDTRLFIHGLGWQRLLYRRNPTMVVTRSFGRQTDRASSYVPLLLDSPRTPCLVDQALHALRTWMDGLVGWRRVAVGMHRQGFARSRFLPACNSTM